MARNDDSDVSVMPKKVIRKDALYSIAARRCMERKRRYSYPSENVGFITSYSLNDRFFQSAMHHENTERNQNCNPYRLPEQIPWNYVKRVIAGINQKRRVL